MKLGSFLIAALGVGVANGQTAVPTVEFIMFSGRDRPKAFLTQADHAQSARDSLQSLVSVTFPCADLPNMGSTPLYNGIIVSFPEPVLERKTMVVQKGFVHYDDGKPCYRDSESRLEALLVGLAFEYEDVNAPQGPRPMEYLACRVPDSLHRGIAPCESSRLASRLRSADDRGTSGVFIRNFSLTGRRHSGARLISSGEKGATAIFILKR
jgi:hypothetical protein